MPLDSTADFVTRAGERCTLSGPENAVCHLVSLLENAGFFWHEVIDAYEENYCEEEA